MKVKDIMIRHVNTCSPSSDLESVAMTMWNEDCGALPVTDAQGRPVGMITDRDICIATALQHRPPSQIKVEEVINGATAVTCRVDQDIKDALKIMQQARVRRLPITDMEGNLQGILSLGDVVTMAPESSGNDMDLPVRDVIGTLKSVSAHHRQA